MTDAAKPYDDWWDEMGDIHVRSPRWTQVGDAVVSFTGSNHSRIRDAEYAWNDERAVFTAEFGIWVDAPTLVEYLGSHELMEHWSRTLSAIVEIGWMLHTWTPVVEGPFYRGFAVFVRPS